MIHECAEWTKHLWSSLSLERSLQRFRGETHYCTKVERSRLMFQIKLNLNLTKPSLNWKVVAEQVKLVQFFGKVYVFMTYCTDICYVISDNHEISLFFAWLLTCTSWTTMWISHVTFLYYSDNFQHCMQLYFSVFHNLSKKINHFKYLSF